jgi:hypothetical protein
LATLAAACAHLTERGIAGEVRVMDDGSTGGTPDRRGRNGR